MHVRPHSFEDFGSVTGVLITEDLRKGRGDPVRGAPLSGAVQE
jgi:hypothetical protein